MLVCICVCVYVYAYLPVFWSMFYYYVLIYLFSLIILLNTQFDHIVYDTLIE